MKIIFYSFFILLVALFSCKNATENKPVAPTANDQNDVNNKNIITKDSNDIIVVGPSPIYDSLPKLSFEAISEATFLQYKKREKKTLITSKPIEKDSFFYFNTQSKKWRFKDKVRDWQQLNDETWYDYVGYDSALKMYVITENSASENLGFGALMLIDNLTNSHYELASVGDGAVNTPIPSPHTRFLVYYYNYQYELKNGFIGLLKMNNRQNPRTFLMEHASYNSEDWGIEDLVWIDDNSFAVKGYEEIYENDKLVKHFSYYKSMRFE